ncbi:DUF371 domain-containing protein [Candidatus Woesearchaeota archaeon]|nr:DUF371 domain-containing protein [Candidatus Woesearchaeota archaeon]
MKYTFTAYGHPNILATHKTTLEITKDTQLTEKGNCIVAVWADFSLLRIKEVIGSCSSNDKILLTIAVAGIKEEIIAVVNKNFGSDKEIVLRKGSFASERTLGIHANKAAAGLSRELVEKLKNSATAVSVTIETHETHHTP